MLALIIVLFIPLGIFKGMGLFFGKETEKDVLVAVMSVYGAEGEPECMKAFAVIINTLIERGEFSPVREEGYLWCDYKGDYSAVSEAVKSVEGQVILYEGAPILPAFHQSSGGQTLSYKSVFGEEIEYLMPVESDKVTEEQTIYKAEIEKAYGVSDGICVSDGGVIIGDKTIPADEFRERFGIYSTVFEMEEGVDSYRVLSSGIGHQVGFSVTGAQMLSREGKSYEEILKHYYKGVSLGKRAK
jgi:stage II sporulation protein D